MIIAIDFDGTIVRGKYPAIDGLMPDAASSILALEEDGHYLIINTCRSGEHLLNAINYLLEQGIPFDRINDNHPDQTRLYKNNSRKVYANLYIDDKNVFGFPGWKPVLEEVRRLEQEWADRQGI